MKYLKILLIAFISISITSCSDSNDAPVFVLSNATIAGTYNMSNFNTDVDLSTEVRPGLSATFSTIKVVGDTFQVDFVLNESGTYTIEGQYRIVTTVTTVSGGNQDVTPSIVNFTDSGTFNINSTNNTITFASSKDDFLGSEYLDKTFTISVFNENSFTITQQGEEFVDPITTKVNGTVSFTRK